MNDKYSVTSVVQFCYLFKTDLPTSLAVPISRSTVDDPT